MRFLLTVHELTKSDLKKLDTFTDKFIKKWSGLPPSATNAIIHMKPGLDIMSTSHLHTLCHSLAFSRTRLIGDTVVNHALDCKLEREAQWVKQHSITWESDALFKDSIQEISQEPLNKKVQIVKETIKGKLYDEKETQWNNHISNLVKQGQFLAIAAKENCDMVWKSHMFNLKRGTLKFLLNACLDTLPTNANLLQWGKSSSDLCKRCLDADQSLRGRRKETTHHILNNCPVSLHQQRYTWRHNNILKYICENIDKSKCTMFSDIPTYSLPGGGTVPPDLCVTAERPDMVVLKDDKVLILELTVPLEPNIPSAHARKFEKYSHFITDIDSHTVKLIPFEIGSRGYISEENKKNLKYIHKICQISTNFSTFCQNLSSISLLSSYYIFISRKSAEWDPLIRNIGPTFK